MFLLEIGMVFFKKIIQHTDQIPQYSFTVAVFDNGHGDISPPFGSPYKH